MDMTLVTALFGWMLVINLFFYLLTAFFVVFARDWAARLEARITGVAEEDWPRLFVDYLGRYKLLILVFNLAPYLALRFAG